MNLLLIISCLVLVARIGLAKLPSVNIVQLKINNLLNNNQVTYSPVTSSIRKRKRTSRVAAFQTSRSLGSCTLDSSEVANTTNMFQVNFVCNLANSQPSNSSSNLCAAAKNAMERATERLSSVLCVYRPIFATVNFYPFCDSTSLSDTSNCQAEEPVNPDSNTIRASAACNTKILGSAAPMQYFDLDDDLADFLGLDPDFRYPSALYKQVVAMKLATAVDSDFSGRNFSKAELEASLDGDDIFASFNSIMNWWYSDRYNGEITSKQYDFEQIAIHELTHGLGMLTSWGETTVNGQFRVFPASLIPEVNGSIKYLNKPYIFDKYLFDKRTGTWMSKLSAQIQNRTNTLMPFKLSDLSTTFNKDPVLLSMLSQATSALTTPGSLSFYYPRWWNVGLQAQYSSTADITAWDSTVIYTPKKFSSGSSGSHVDQDVYLATSEFLMRPFGTSGVDTKAYQPKSFFGPIGFGTVNILQTLGYHTIIMNGKFRQGLGNAMGNSIISQWGNLNKKF